MANFRFTPLVPHPALQPYLAKLWIFESEGRMPEMEEKLIVPNGNFKLAFAYRNGIGTTIAGQSFTMPEYQLTISGIIDEPVRLDPQDDILTGTIGVEIKPLGAYRFFRLNYTELKNQILPLEELIGRKATDLRWRMTEAVTVELKVKILQNFLLRQLHCTATDSIFEYCVQRIIGTHGIVSVAQLEKETGYSSRWLHNKFTDCLGTGPKNLSAIIKFGQFYDAFAAGDTPNNLKVHIYQHYHDQSHFLRAFKRFTGSTPTELQHSLNELGTRAFRA